MLHINTQMQLTRQLFKIIDQYMLPLIQRFQILIILENHPFFKLHTLYPPTLLTIRASPTNAVFHWLSANAYPFLPLNFYRVLPQ